PPGRHQQVQGPILEYDKALRSLKDATLLFNRGECHRKTGQAAKAIADYKQFLAELPAAPNRAQVEAQIAALEKATTVAPPTPAALAVKPAEKRADKLKDSDLLTEPDLAVPDSPARPP